MAYKVVQPENDCLFGAYNIWCMIFCTYTYIVYMYINMYKSIYMCHRVNQTLGYMYASVALAWLEIQFNYMYMYFI